MFAGITPAQWLSAGSQVLGSALKPAGAGPSQASSSVYNDGSGWSVVVGSGSASASTGTQWPMLLAVLGAAAVFLWAKR